MTVQLLRSKLRFTTLIGKSWPTNLEAANYPEYLGEAVDRLTFMKFPITSPWAIPRHVSRGTAGADQRLWKTGGTPLAQQEWIEFAPWSAGRC